jgi:hypothetical protein
MTTFELKQAWIIITNWNKSKRWEALEQCGHNCAFNGEDKEHCFVFFKRVCDPDKWYLTPIIVTLMSEMLKLLLQIH